MTTAMENMRDRERADYERVVGDVRQGEVSFRDHPGFQYLSSGFAEGFAKGFQVSAGASHAALSTVIGNLDSGVWGLEEAKESLIGLRNHIVQEAGL